MLITNSFKQLHHSDVPVFMARRNAETVIPVDERVGAVISDDEVTDIDYVYTPSRSDTSSYDHPGNELVRELLVASHKEYRENMTGAASLKHVFCCLVLDEILVRGGRFLEKVDDRHWQVMDVDDHRLLRRCRDELDAIRARSLATAAAAAMATGEVPPEIKISADNVRAGDVGGPRDMKRPGQVLYQELTRRSAAKYENDKTHASRRAIRNQIYDEITSPPNNGRFLLKSKESAGKFLVGRRDNPRVIAMFAGRFQCLDGSAEAERKQAKKREHLRHEPPSKKPQFPKKKPKVLYQII